MKTTEKIQASLEQELKDRTEWQVKDFLVKSKTLRQFANIVDLFEVEQVAIYGTNLEIKARGRDDWNAIKQHVSGTWERHLPSYARGPEDFYYMLRNEEEGWTLTVASCPPPSCEFVTEEIVVPSRVEKRTRMVCHDGNGETEQTDVPSEPSTT